MSIEEFVAISVVVIVVGLLVGWQDRRRRLRERRGDTISPKSRFPYREFDGRSSSQLLSEGALVVTRGAETWSSSVDVGRKGGDDVT